MRFIDKVKKKLKSGSWYPFYNSFYERERLDFSRILLESRSGRALESNILSILKELQKEEYRQFSPILSVHKSVRTEIEKKLRQNGIRRVHLTATGSVDYYRELARAGYLVNDTTFPGRFVKKKGQVYLNTWHGTPLKKMGRDNRPESLSMGNVLRNLLDSDYLVFPNRFMEEKMAGAYMLNELYRGTVLREGYPRNDIFRRKPDLSPKKSAGWEAKKLYMYLPTFRGLADQVDTGAYMDILSAHLALWDKELSDDELLLVKLHPFLHGNEDFHRYRHIRAFPTDWDTYEGLSLCDTLITDYSSVFYDYANTGKKVVLFAYDRAEYERGRGMYEDISSYPFLYTEQPEEVVPLLHQEGGTPTPAFLETYATWEDGHGTEKICREVFLKEDCCRKMSYKGNGKKNVLLYGGDLGQNGITSALFSLLEELDLTRYNYFLSFRTLSVLDHPECIERIPQGVGIYPLASEMNMDALTMAALMLKMKGTVLPGISHRVHRAYRREWRKHFGNRRFFHVIHYNGYEAYVTSLLEEAPCTRSIWLHSDMYRELCMKGNHNRYLLREAYRTYDHVVPVSSDSIRTTVEKLGADPSRITVIPNCHDYRRVRERSRAEIAFDPNTVSNVTEDRLKEILANGRDKFISIGRFSPEKGHLRLMDAFDQYRQDHPDTWLIIIGGGGELYDKTLEHANSLASSGHIVLIRSMSNPMPVLKRCSLFLLSSFYEGQGLVLLEADTLGVPVMACNVPGPRGLLTEHGGILLEDSTEGLLKGMELFAQGKAHTLTIDYEEMNRNAAAKAEALIAQGGPRTSRRRRFPGKD